MAKKPKIHTRKPPTSAAIEQFVAGGGAAPKAREGETTTYTRKAGRALRKTSAASRSTARRRFTSVRALRRSRPTCRFLNSWCTCGARGWASEQLGVQPF